MHTNFTWMLKAGALTYTETLYTSKDLLTKLHIKDVSAAPNKPNIEFLTCMSLRSLLQILGKDVFHIMLYCTLTGINVSCLILFLMVN